MAKWTINHFYKKTLFSFSRSTNEESKILTVYLFHLFEAPTVGLFTDRNPEMERTKAAHMNGKREYLMGYSCEGSRQHQGPFHGFKHSTEREREPLASYF